MTTERQVIGLAVLLALFGCTSTEKTVSTGPPAPSEQVESVQRASRTESPGDALRILRNTEGQAGPVFLTLKGILLVESGRYGRATGAMRSALRLVESGKGFVASGANLPRLRPAPEQQTSGDLPAVTAERDLVETFRKAVHRDVTNEALLRELKRRSVPVRYPPIHGGGAGLTLEVLRQHFGDKALRLQLLPYRSPKNGSPKNGKNETGNGSSGTIPAGGEDQMRRRVAAQNLIVASILARDATLLRQGQKALKKILAGSFGTEVGAADLQARRHSALYLALANYILGRQVGAVPLPQKARRLLSSSR